MDWKLGSECRRDFLKKGVAVGSGGVISSMVITGEVTASTVSKTEWDQFDSHDEKRLPDITYEHNLGSGLEHVAQKSGGTHSFRIAGDYCIVEKPADELPPERPASTASTSVKLENESADELSIFTSDNSDEIAFNPVGETDDNRDAFSVVNAAVSLAAGIAKKNTVGIALDGIAMVDGMTGLMDNGDQGNGVYEWKVNPDSNNDRRGGHHVDFKVEEKGNEGSITVASKTHHLSNTWRLTFSGNGLTDVTEI